MSNIDTEPQIIGRRVLDKGTIKTLVASLLVQGCGVITGILTARILGPTGRGELVAIMLWPSILSNLGIMGINWALAREVAAQRDKHDDIIILSIALCLPLAFVYLCLGYFFIPYLLPQDKIFLIGITHICLLQIPLDGINQTLLAVDQGQLHWNRFNLLRALWYFPYILFIILIWSTGYDQVSLFIFALLLSHLVALITRLWLHRKSLLKGRIIIGDAFLILKSGFPYFWATLGNLLRYHIDKILIVSLLPTKAAGIYAVALGFSSLQVPFGEALGISSFAKLANEYNIEEQGRLISNIFKRASLVLLLLGGFLMIIAPLIIVPVFGHEFSGAIKPAIVLVIASTMIYLGDILNQGLRGIGKPYPGFISHISGVVILVLLSLQLCPKLGLMGIVWASIFGGFSQLVIIGVLSIIILKIQPILLWPFHLEEINYYIKLYFLK
jgi:O-antigen/teichoic acid export membrane protein